jgi:hypothetical protein
MDRSTSRRRSSSWPSSARSTARRCGTAGAGNRSAPPSRFALAALCFPLSGRVYGRWGVGRGARPSARWRLPGVRRRRRARVARMAAGETAAGGRRPPRSSPAIVWASSVSVWVVPPGIACISRAWPRTKGRPACAPRAASQSHGKLHATAMTLASR